MGMDDAASPVNGVAPPESTRWKPGQSGNPKGRPKGVSITALVRKALEGRAYARLEERLAPDATGKMIPAGYMVHREELPEGVTVAEMVAGAIVTAAVERKDVRFIREVWERVDGKVPAKVQAEGFVLTEIVAEAEEVAMNFKPAPRPKGK